MLTELFSTPVVLLC